MDAILQSPQESDPVTGVKVSRVVFVVEEHSASVILKYYRQSGAFAREASMQITTVDDYAALLGVTTQPDALTNLIQFFVDRGDIPPVDFPISG